MENIDKKTFIIIAVVLFFLVAGVTTILIVNSNKKTAEKVEEKQQETKNDTSKDSSKKEDSSSKTDKKDDKDKDKDKEKEEDNNLPKLPDLTGMTVEEATAKLNSERIASDFTIQREDSDLKSGVIVRTEPKAGSPLPTEEKLQIIFYLSNGKKKIVIEDYEGKDYKEVKKYLEDRGIKVTLKQKTPDYERTDVPDGMIVDQSVAAGKELKSGDSIILYIPKLNVKYPNFTDGTYRLADVQKFCDQYDIKLTVLYDEVTTYEDGLVFYQDGCMPGEEVKAGCEMTIKIAQH